MEASLTLDAAPLWVSRLHVLLVILPYVPKQYDHLGNPFCEYNPFCKKNMHFTYNPKSTGVWSNVTPPGSTKF
jgi:hypothetical protein